MNKKYTGRLNASFTVEASLIVPLVVIIIVMGLHFAMELQGEVIAQAKKEPAVEALEPIKEMYKDRDYISEK